MPDSVILVTAADAEAIAAGRHGDPFAVLGPHRVKGGVVVRTLQPQAHRVWALVAAGEVEMDRVHADGLFAVRLAKSEPYRLVIEQHDGAMFEIDDPYRFAPLLGDLDIHLLAEGTHLRTFEKLGAHLRSVEGD